MSLNNENNPNEMRIAVGAITSDTVFELMRLDKKIKIIDVQLLDPTGETEDGTNFIEVELLRDAVIIAAYSTEDTAEGTLAAGVWTKFPETNIIVENDADLILNLDVNGTGNLNAGAVVVIKYFSL